LGLLWPRTAAPAAGVALGYFFLWWLLLRVPAFVVAPLDAAGGLGENTVALAGALALYAALHPAGGALESLRGRRGTRLARILLGIGLLGCGEAHFRFLKETADFVPAWIPGHRAWAIATGSGFLAAGVAILVAVWARLAASLAAAMMGAFTVLIWFTDVAAGQADRFHWTGSAVSWTLTAAAWAVAESYRDTEWLGLPWGYAGDYCQSTAGRMQYLRGSRRAVANPQPPQDDSELLDAAPDRRDVGSRGPENDGRRQGALESQPRQR